MPIMNDCDSTLLSVTNKTTFKFKPKIESSIKTNESKSEKSLHFGNNNDLVIYYNDDGRKYV